MEHFSPFASNSSRRAFVSTLSKATLAGWLLSSPIIAGAHKKNWTVGDIMDLFIKEVAGTSLPQTVDTLKAGSRDQGVTGIVTTMFATISVIKEAISLGANFIIAHEPTFFNHLDKTDWLQNDATYQYKRKLLSDNKIAIWRNHDYIHSHQPDGVYSGLIDKLGWQSYAQSSSPAMYEMPETTLMELIKTVKEKLGVKMVRYIGEDKQVCRKVLLMPGAAGGERQIKAIGQFNPDVAVIGEVQEWETAEYVRDYRAAGKSLSLVVLGHTDSEDAGSIYMKNWLTKNVPGIKVAHLYSGNPFNFA
jgi:putative NIF3 family GTP cyclohydrolase 1 type 2